MAPKPGQLGWTPAQAGATSPGMLLKLPGPQEVITACTPKGLPKELIHGLCLERPLVRERPLV